jgi:hypothetical protein
MLLESEPFECRHSDFELVRMFDDLVRKYNGTGSPKLAIIRSGRSPLALGQFKRPKPETGSFPRLYVYGDFAAADRLLVLCHELGHWRSWQRNEPAPLYFDVVSPWSQWPHRTDNEKHVIIEEEERAWAHGWDFATEAGFSDRVAYLRHRDRGLAAARSKLGLAG